MNIQLVQYMFLFTLYTVSFLFYFIYRLVFLYLVRFKIRRQRDATFRVAGTGLMPPVIILPSHLLVC